MTRGSHPMGFRLRGAVRCGRCGKPRGIRHTCVARFGSRTRRHRVQTPVTWVCSSCGKPRGLRHTCTVRTDFAKRKAAAARQVERDAAAAKKRAAASKRRDAKKAAAARRNARRKQAAAERKARDKARKVAARTARTRPARPRGDSHEPGTCGDRDCPKYGCKSYWAGMEDCPLPHNG